MPDVGSTKCNHMSLNTRVLSSWSPPFPFECEQLRAAWHRPLRTLFGEDMTRLDPGRLHNVSQLASQNTSRICRSL